MILYSRDSKQKLMCQAWSTDILVWLFLCFFKKIFLNWQNFKCGRFLSKIWIFLFPLYNQASLVAQTLMNLPVMQETWVPFLGREDPLEKGMATHSSILVWRIP